MHWLAQKELPQTRKGRIKSKRLFCVYIHYVSIPDGIHTASRSLKRSLLLHHRISTQNPTPCMSKIRHLRDGLSTHTLFFAVDGVTSDLWHSTNVGWRSDRPLCHIFDHFSFQSANQNCINRWKFDVLWPLKCWPSDGQKCQRKGDGISNFIQRVLEIRCHLTL